MSEQANCCCAGRKNGCDKVKLISQPENPCLATSSCCQRRCIIQQLANKTFKVCEPVFLDNDFDFTATADFTATPVTPDTTARYTSGSSKSVYSKCGSGSPGTPSPKYTSGSCCDTAEITPFSSDLIGGTFTATSQLCPKFNLRCNTCYDYMLFGCPRTTCQSISAAGIGAWISSRDYLSSGDACFEVAKKCVRGCTGTDEEAVCAVIDDPDNGKTDKDLEVYYFTYSLTWQQCVGAFEVHINVCGLPVQGSGWWNGDPTCNIQLSQTTPLFDSARKFANNIFDFIEELEDDVKTASLTEALEFIGAILKDNGNLVKLIEEGDSPLGDILKCFEAEDQPQCFEETFPNLFPQTFTANYGYSLGSGSFTLVPYNSCRTSHYARRAICSAQHCLDGFNRQLRTSKRRKGKKKPSGSRY